MVMNVLNSGSKTRYRDSNSPFSSFTAIFSRSEDPLLEGLYGIIYLKFHFKVLHNKNYQQNSKLKRFIFSTVKLKRMRLGNVKHNLWFKFELLNESLTMITIQDET